MGTGFVDKESEKAEHWAIFLIVSGIFAHVFSKYASINIDMVTFGIYVAMCFAAYMTYQSAKEFIKSLSARRQTAYEALKMDMNTVRDFEMTSSKTRKGAKFSKYVTSTYIENARNLF